MADWDSLLTQLDTATMPDWDGLAADLDRSAQEARFSPSRARLYPEDTAADWIADRAERAAREYSGKATAESKRSRQLSATASSPWAAQPGMSTVSPNVDRKYAGDTEKDFAEFKKLFPQADRQAFDESMQDTYGRALNGALIEQLTQARKGETADLGQRSLRRSPFLGAGLDAREKLRVKSAFEAIEKGNASLEDFDAAAQFRAEAQKAQEQGFGGKVADLLAELPGFAVEFMATGGLYTAGKTAARKGAEKMLGRQLAESGLERLAVGAAGRGLGVGLQAAALSGRTAETYAQSEAQRMGQRFGLSPEEADKQFPDPGIASALPKAFLDTLIEVGSERTGAALTRGAWGKLAQRFQGVPLPKVMESVRQAAVNKWAAKTGGTVAEAEGLMQKLGFNGFLGELFEERVGDVARGVTGVRPDFGTTGGVLSGKWEGGLQELLVEAAAFAVPGVSQGIASTSLDGLANKAADRLMQRGQLFQGQQPAATTPSAEGDTSGQLPGSGNSGNIATISGQPTGSFDPGRPALEEVDPEERLAMLANQQGQVPEDVQLAQQMQPETPGRGDTPQSASRTPTIDDPERKVREEIRVERLRLLGNWAGALGDSKASGLLYKAYEAIKQGQPIEPAVQRELVNAVSGRADDTPEMRGLHYEIRQALAPLRSSIDRDPTLRTMMETPAGRLNPTEGWKLHLASGKAEEVSQVLKSLGLKHKVGRSGQSGKDLTVYIGSRDKADEAARLIEEKAGHLLDAPRGETIEDDVPFTGKVVGRFDVGGTDKAFHQYGGKGLPYLIEDMDRFNPRGEGAHERADAALKAKYGEFYTGKAKPTLKRLSKAEVPAAQPAAQQPVPKPLAKATPAPGDLAKWMANNVSGMKREDQKAYLEDVAADKGAGLELRQAAKAALAEMKQTAKLKRLGKSKLGREAAPPVSSPDVKIDQDLRGIVQESNLTAREKKILTARLAGSTMEAVGKQLLLSRERVRQIENEAMGKIGPALAQHLGIDLPPGAKPMPGAIERFRQAERAGGKETAEEGAAQLQGGELRGTKQRAFQGPLPVTPAALPPTGETVSPHSVIKALEKLFQVPMFDGRLPKRLAAIYKTASETIRRSFKALGNIPVAVHEIGHHYVDRLNVLDAFQGQDRRDLEKLDYDQGRKLELARLRKQIAKLKRIANRTQGQEDRLSSWRSQAKEIADKSADEGFAEYLRLRLTTDDAATQAPAVHAAFESWLPAAERARLDQARNWIDRYRRQDEVQRVKAGIAFDSEAPRALDEGTLERIKDRIAKGYLAFHKHMIDQHVYLKQYDRYAKRLGVQLPEGIGLYESIAALGHNGQVYAGRAIADGVFDLETQKKIGPSLIEAFEGIKPEEMDDFLAFLVARAGRERFQKGQQPGAFSEAEADATYKRFADRWTKNAVAFTNFHHALIDMLARAGVITAEDAKNIKEAADYYAPLLKIIEEKGSIPDAPGKKKLLDQGAAVKRFKGSGAPIRDPLAASVQYTVQHYQRAIQTRAMRRAVEMMEQIQTIHKKQKGIDPRQHWILEVPPEQQATIFQVADVAKQLKDAGLDPEALDAIDPLAQLAVFRPDYFKKRPGEPVGVVVMDGKRRVFQFDPELHQALAGLDEQSMHWFLRFFAPFTRLRKLGYTGLNLGFTIPNFIADMTAYFYQRRHGNLIDPFTGVAKLIYGGVRAATGKRLPATEYEEVWQRLWQEQGGPLGTSLGLDKDTMQRAVRKIRGNKSGMDMGKGLLDWLRDVVGFTEAAPRIAEMKGALEARGWDAARIKAARAKGESPPLDVLIAAVNAANEVTLNFRRAGLTSQKISQIIPFFNAGVQGVETFWRRSVEQLRDNPSGLAVRLLALVAMRAAYWAMVKDDDEYQEAPGWERYSQLIVPRGNWLREKLGIERIPLRGSVNAYVLTPVQMMLDAAYGKHSSPLMDGIKKIGEESMPPIKPTGVEFLEAAINFDFFRWNKIVHDDESRGAPRPHNQVRPETTATMKGIADLLSKVGIEVSPARLEHVVQGMTGGLYGQAARPAEHVAGLKKLGRAHTPVVSRFTFGQEFSESNNDLQETASRLDGEINSAIQQTIEEAKAKGKKLTRDDAKDKVPEEKLRAAARMDKLQTLYTKIQQAVRSEGDASREERFALEKYQIGLARAILGKEPLPSYPNPIKAGNAPPAIRGEVQKWLENLADAAEAEPARTRRIETVAQEQQRKREFERNKAVARQILNEMKVSRGSWADLNRKHDDRRKR